MRTPGGHSRYESTQVIIKHVDETLTGTIIPGQSEPENNGNEEVLHTLKNWSLTIRYSLESYLGHSFLRMAGVLPISQGYRRRILSLADRTFFKENFIKFGLQDWELYFIYNVLFILFSNKPVSLA